MGKELKLAFYAIIISAVAALAFGCSLEVSESDAKQASIEFVSEHVKFFSRNGSENVNLTEYNFTSFQIAEAQETYSVELHVTATLGNSTKESDLSLAVDKKTGTVTKLNGKKVPNT